MATTYIPVTPPAETRQDSVRYDVIIVVVAVVQYVGDEPCVVGVCLVQCSSVADCVMAKCV